MSVTINGQLLLTMLCEKLQNISTVLQINTDGISIKIHKDKLEEMKTIIKWWEDLTQLELESEYYSKMVIRDVNNYLAVYTNGKIKYKGTFEIDKEMKGEIQYHKNHSKRIVPIAVRRHFIEGIPVEETIRNHMTVGDYCAGEDCIKNYGIYDFCIGMKTKGGVKGKPKAVTRKIVGSDVVDTEHQKTNRYYISKKGEHFVKKYNDGSTSQVEAHPQKGRFYKAVVMNDFEKKEDYNIDYSYYIREANKIVNQIVDYNYSLF